VCVGALQDDRGITINRHIHADDQPEYCRMAGDAIPKPAQAGGASVSRGGGTPSQERKSRTGCRG